jgi:hypothetical protein
VLLIDRVYVELVAAGAAQPLSGVTSGVPVCWRAPADGVPAPGEGRFPAPLVLGVLRGGGIPRSRFEASQWRTDQIDLHYRAMTSVETEQMYAAARRVLVDKVNVAWGGMRIIESQEARSLDYLSSSAAQGFHGVSAVMVETYVEDWG